MQMQRIPVPNTGMENTTTAEIHLVPPENTENIAIPKIKYSNWWMSRGFIFKRIFK